MEENYETIITGYPDVIDFDCSKEIINQMEKNICKIKIGEEQGTGFFCKIPFPDENNMLNVLITNNHVINETILFKEDEYLSIYIEKEKIIRKLNLNGRIKYTKSKKEYDITIIEIKEEDEIKNFLELDDKIINDITKNENENVKYLDKTFYIIHYPKGELSVSYGVISDIYEYIKYKFNHKCSTELGSSGAPILTLKNKVIGLHTGGNKLFNLGTFLNEPIKDFIKKYNNKKINSKNSKKEEEISGLIKLCLLKEISLKLSDDNFKNLNTFFTFIMQSLKNINVKYINDSKKEIKEVLLCLLKEISLKLKDNNFTNLNTFFSFIMKSLQNFHDKYIIDSKEEIKEILHKIKGNNIINFSDFIEETIKIEQINELMNLLNSDNIKEINNKKLNLIKYNDEINLFNEGFKQAKRESIFEFSLVSLVIMRRDDFEKFKQEKKNCPNRVDKILFHGTIIDPISVILTEHFINPHKSFYSHPSGVCFTDLLDYCWYFGKDRDIGHRAKFNIIPKVGDNFTLVVSSIYYDKNRLFRSVDYHKYTGGKNVINLTYNDADNSIITAKPDSTKFFGTEYEIYNLEQIFPIFGAKLKRNEFCIIWRDNNFSSKIIINDKLKILKNNFLKERIRYIKQFLNYNVYPCETSEEALKLLERKKYNKIILLSNIGSNLEGKKFVENARKILGNDVITLFVSYNTNHLKWIKDYKNALFINEPKLIEEYLKSFEDNYDIKDKIKLVIRKSENYYKVKFNFDNNFLHYPFFKNEGKYTELTFNI